MQNSSSNFEETPAETSFDHRNATLIWKDLSVTVERVESSIFGKDKRFYKQIIRNVNGAVEAGTLVAILGSSGAGKSTLMGALAHRNQNNSIVEGDIRVLGRHIGKFMNEISGFVYQNDLFIPTLTVKEHLMFAAKLKIGLQISNEQLEGRINAILMNVGLIRIRDKEIGSSFLEKEEVHLSGGEQKRLSVAIELLTNPLFLFCDEPTTGLDSFSALKLVTILRNTAQRQMKTIVCSIHQPSAQVFELFHRVILLSQGRIVFMGNKTDSISFMESQGHTYSEDQNLADFLVNCISRKASIEIQLMSCNFQVGKYHKPIQYSLTNKEEKKVPESEFKAELSPSWIYTMYLLTYRNFLANTRDLSVLYLRILQQVLLSVIIGMCMKGAVTMTQAGTQAVFGFIFMLVYENSFPAMSGSITLIPKKIDLFFREYSNGMNSPLKFLLSSIFSLIPSLVVEAVLFTLTLYWVVSYEQSLKVIGLTCLVVVMLICTSSAFGMFMSILCKTSAVAVISAVPIFNAFILCAGFYIRLSSLPVYGVWIKFSSWLAYATELFFILQWNDVHYIECSKNVNVPCLRNGDEVLAYYDYDKNNFWFDIYMLIFMFFLFNTASYVCLLCRTKNKT